ncbi:hypothetical protein SCHPADRAFT_911972, partial [Schizopora paradoxa]
MPITRLPPSLIFRRTTSKRAECDVLYESRRTLSDATCTRSARPAHNDPETHLVRRRRPAANSRRVGRQERRVPWAASRTNERVLYDSEHAACCSQRGRADDGGSVNDDGGSVNDDG